MFLLSVVVFVFYFLISVNKFVFAEFQTVIPNDSDNFKYSACSNKGFQCAADTITDRVIPNVTTGLCDTDWTPVCFYDSEGNYDVNVPICSCRKLQIGEGNPVTHTNNACTCKNGTVNSDECNSGMIATCITSDSTVGGGMTSNCSCLTPEVSQQQQLQPQHPSNLCEGGGGTGIQTALGCVPYTIEGFVSWLLQILFGISGGIAFLLMVYGFILMATSSGDEKKVQGAKETVTSAITGLLVSIFALFIFRLIAVNILHIPGIG